jgi:hypothetical protein
MNQPDGDCCFCMFPLSMGYESSGLKSLMKLMSCFHCFHRLVNVHWSKSVFFWNVLSIDQICVLSNSCSDCFSKWFRWILFDRGLSCELMLDRNQDENMWEVCCLKKKITYTYLQTCTLLVYMESHSIAWNWVRSQRNLLEALQLKCPVCRKSVNAEDILSIHNTVTAHSLNEEVS